MRKKEPLNKFDAKYEEKSPWIKIEIKTKFIPALIRDLTSFYANILEDECIKEWNKAEIDQKFTEEDFKRYKNVQR
jgi:hypothetical protein